MSVIEALNDNCGSVPEDVARAFIEDLGILASRLSPENQARLMAFVHLAGNHEAIQTDLKISPSGEVTLVLRHPSEG